MARLLGDTPPALHDAVVTAASTEFVRFSLTDAPLVDAAGTGRRSGTIAAKLSSALAADRERIRVAPLWTRHPHHGKRDGEERLRGRGHDEDQRHGSRRGRLGWFTASVALRDGPWLNIEVGPPPGAPPWGWTFVGSFVLSALGIALVAVLMARRADDTLAFIREDMRREGTRTVDLPALVDSVAADLVDLGHDIAVADRGRVLVACRPVALRRALRNLLENACEYGDRASVRIVADGDQVRVVIEDEGTGIAQADLERVFEPFVRIEESRSPDTGGSGLGLAIARSIVRGHGGDIRLENRGVGGLRATISLPGAEGG